MLGMFWEMHQQSKITEASQHARESAFAANESRRAVAQLESRIDQLTMIVQAMWRLLQERTGMTDQQLMDKVQQIDLTDGKLDGKVRRDIMKCPSCQRSLAPRHLRCMYCGAEADAADAFDRVI